MGGYFLGERRHESKTTNSPPFSPPLPPLPQALQYVQNNPDEVCPAGWTPGAATMKPTPADSKEYFKAL